MLVQKQKAKDQKIEFVATFKNFLEASEEQIQMEILTGQQVIKQDDAENQPLEKVGVDEKYSPVVCTDESRVKQVLLGL